MSLNTPEGWSEAGDTLRVFDKLTVGIQLLQLVPRFEPAQRAKEGTQLFLD